MSLPEQAVSEPVATATGEPGPAARRPRRPPSRLRRVRRSLARALAPVGRVLGAGLRWFTGRIPGGAWLIGRWRLLVNRWRHLPRFRARAVLAGLVFCSFAAGMGLGGLVLALSSREPAGVSTELGPVRIALPEELGPWSRVPEDRFESLRNSSALGSAVIDGAWGAVTEDAVVVTVLTTQPDMQGGLDALRVAFDDSRRLEWSGRDPHIAGWTESEGVRELTLVAERDDGALVLLSISGPAGSFASGELDDAFREARVIG